MPRGELASMTADEMFVKYRGKLDDAHLEKAGAMLQAAKDPDAAKHAEVVTVNEAVKRGAKKSGIIPWTGTPSSKQAEAYADYETEIDRRTKAFESSLGGKRPANSDEVSKIVDGVLMDKVFVQEFGRDPQKPTYQLKPSDIKNAYVKVGETEVKVTDIPPAQRMDIISELRKRKMPVNEQIIADYWLRAGSPK